MSARAERDVLIFIGTMVASGWAGVWLNQATGATDPMQGAGTLLWLLTPVLMGIVLSVLAGQPFRRLGLGLGGRGAVKWYVLAFAATPAAILIVLPAGLATGTIVLTGAAEVGGLVAGFLASSAVKNVFEELSWRGFLTPALEETRFKGLGNHLLTGLVWALWHLPYWLFFIPALEITAHAGLPLSLFVALAFVVLPVQAILYGELRLATGSMWPAWLLHTVSNLVALTLLSGGLAVAVGPLAFVLSPGTSGLVYSALIGALGVWVYMRRRPAVAKGTA